MRASVHKAHNLSQFGIKVYGFDNLSGFGAANPLHLHWMQGRQSVQNELLVRSLLSPFKRLSPLLLSIPSIII